MGNRPGGELAARPLQFIWIADCSGSMQGKKIEALNFAIREAIKPMQDVADENPNAQVMVRAIKFSDSATWHISQPTEVHDFKWTDLNADGVTDMGKALDEVAKALKLENMPERGLPPVLILISDGQPTDDFNSGLKRLMDEPWGKRAVRIAVAIGDDADLEVLQKFIGHPEVKPLQATNASDLVKKIKWASTVPLKAASSPASRMKDQADFGLNVPIPAPPSDVPPASANEVF
ncbi:MAG: VWA domain-containing protein [Planctomycetota bacterium]|nr:VWA domain-containing protein [Planctomycetota bacterium]